MFQTLVRYSTYIGLVTIYVVLTVVLLGFLVSQTNWFRTIVRDQIVEITNQNLNGRLTIGSIDGNFISRLTIKEVSLTGPDSSLIVTADEVSIRYMPVFLLFGNVSVSEIRLANPQFNMVADSAGFIISRLTNGSSPDTTQSDPMDLTSYSIKIAKIVVDQGIFRFDTGIDSPSGLQSFNYQSFTLDSLNLTAGFSNSPGKKTELVLSAFSANDSASSFTVERISTAIRYQDRALSVDSLRIMTDSSSLFLSAQWDNPALLTLDSLWTNHVLSSRFTGIVQLAPFHFSDLRFFLPFVNMLEGSVQLEAEVTGTLDTLLINRLMIGLGDSTRLIADGQLRNMLDFNRMYIQSSIYPSKILYREISDLLPSIPVPDFSSAGLVTLNGTYRGHPLDFYASSSIVGESGGLVSGDLELNMLNEPIYRAEALFNNVNLMNWLNGNPVLNSSLSGTMTVAGKGFTFPGVNLTSTVRLKGSEFQHYKIDSIGGNISIPGDSVIVNFDVAGSPGSFNLAGIITPLATGFRASANLNIANLDFNQFSSALAVTAITGDLSMSGEFSDSLDVVADIHWSDWTVNGVPFGESNHQVQVFIPPDESFDIAWTGNWFSARFSGDKKIQYWINHANQAIHSIPYWISADSTTSLVADKSAFEGFGELNWSWSVRQIVPIVSLFNAPLFQIAGKAAGKTSVNNLSTLATFDVSIDSLRYADKIQVAGLNLVGIIDSFSLVSSIRSASGNMTCIAESIKTPLRNWGKLEALAWFNNGAISLSTELIDPEKLFSAILDLDMMIRPTAVDLKIVQLVASLRSGDWVLDDSSMIRIDPTKVVVENFNLVAPVGKLTVDGGLGTGTSEGLSITGVNITPDEIVRSVNPSFQLFPGGSLSFSVNAWGDFIHPSVNATAQWTDISLGNTVYGNLILQANVEGSFLTFDSQLVDRQGKASFAANGYYPLFQAGGRDNDQKNRMKATVYANSLDISLFQNFLGNVGRIGGIADANLVISGDAGNPGIEGNLNLRNGLLLLAANGVQYRNISGSATLSNDLIRIKNLDATTDGGGALKSYGSFRLKNYLPASDFNLTVVLNNLAVLNKPPSPGENYYGNVDLTGTMTLRGGLNRSFLNGNLRIRRAALTVVTATANLRQENEDSFIRFVSAVSKEDSVTENGSNGLSPDRDQRPTDRAFLSGLSSFVQIDASQNAYLTIILNRATGEQLQTDLNGNLTLQYQNEALTANGNLNVNSGFYNFYTTQFQVEKDGTIQWTGDLAAPELNLVAKSTITRVVSTDPVNPETEVNIISLGIKGSVLEPVLTYDISSTRTNNVSGDFRQVSTLENPDMKDKAPANIISLLLIGQWLYDPYVQGANLQFNLQNDLTSTTLNAGFGVLSNHIGRFLAGVDNRIRYVNFKVDNQGGKAENIGGTFVYDISENWSFTGGLSYNLSDERTSLTGQTDNSRLGLSWRLENKLTNSLSWDIFQSYDPYTFDTRDQIVRGVSLFYRKNFYRFGDFFKQEQEGATELERSEGKSQAGSPPVPGE